MSWPETRFSLSALEVGDEVIAEGDDFEAFIEVIRAGTFPGAILLEGPDDRKPTVIQILGHGIYNTDIDNSSTFVLPGVVGGGGNIIFCAFDGANGVDLQKRSLTRWKVIRDGQIVYNRGETGDDDGDAEFPPED